MESPARKCLNSSIWLKKIASSRPDWRWCLQLRSNKSFLYQMRACLGALWKWKLLTWGWRHPAKGRGYYLIHRASWLFSKLELWNPDESYCSEPVHTHTAFIYPKRVWRGLLGSTGTTSWATYQIFSWICQRYAVLLRTSTFHIGRAFICNLLIYFLERAGSITWT